MLRLPRVPRVLWALPLLLLPLLLSGCVSAPSPEQAREALAEADAQVERGSYDSALKNYLRAAQGDPKASLEIRGEGGRSDPKRTVGGEALLKAAAIAARVRQYESAVHAYESAAKLPADRTAVLDGRTVKVRDYARAHLASASAALDQANSKSVLFQIMDFMVRATGRHPAFSYWIAILLFTLVVKIALTPLTNMQFRATRKMMRIQPRLKELQEQYKDRPQEFQTRMMALYREEGVNPFGCGASMVVQIPIMIALYRVIQLYRTRFAEGHFLWIGSPLADQYPGVIGQNLAQPDIPLLILYSISMYASQRLTMVPAADPQQMQQQKMMAYMMPVMFFFILQAFPSAFVLYWLLFNVFTTAQQYHLMKHAEAQEATAGAGGAASAPPTAVQPRPRPAPQRPRKGGSRRR